MDIINKPDPTTTEDSQLLPEILGRLRALEEGLAAMQLGFTRIQEAVQPALSTKGACGGGGGGAEPVR